MAFGDVKQFNSGTGTTASVTPTLGVATVANNLLILTVAADDYNAAPPAFWIERTGGRQHTFHGGYLWDHLCTGGDTIAAYSIGSAVRSAWTLVEYEGPFDTSRYDISAGQNTTASSQTYTTPNITPTAGDRLLVAGLQWQNGGSDLIALTGFTNSFTQAAAVLYNGANPRLSLAQTKRVVTANGSTAYGTGGTTTPNNFNSASAIIAAFKKGAVAAGGNMKVWNGTAWVEKPAKVWTGSAWTQKPVKFWNGSAWVLA